MRRLIPWFGSRAEGGCLRLLHALAVLVCLVPGAVLAAAPGAAPRVAVVIAVEEYPPGSGFPPVPGAIGDARDIADGLRKAGYAVRELVGALATRRAIMEVLSAGESGCSEEAELWVSFTGRAYGEAGGDFLAPYDARSDDLAASGVPPSSLTQLCSDRSSLLLLDIPSEPRPPGLLILRPPLRLPPGQSELRASGPGRDSFFDPDLGGRVFGRAVISALRGAAVDASGTLCLHALARSVDREVRRWSFEHHRDQAPLLALGSDVVLATGLPPGTAESSLAGPTRISLSVKDADLVEALRSLARLGSVQLVLDPAVKGTVTLELDDVPWDQAFEMILKTHDLGAAVDGSMARVSPVGRED